MTAVLPAPAEVAPGPADPAGGRSGRRSRRRVVIWAGAAVVALALVGLSLVRTTGFDGPVELRFAPDAEAVTLPAFEGGTHVLRYRHGDTVSFSFPLRNRGLLPLTITEVRIEEDRWSLVHVDDVRVGSEPLPVRLGAGDTATVEVTARYGNCRYYHERELQSLDAVSVEASTLGVHRTRRVPLDHPLVIPSPMIVDCPDRTLVRDDDVRR